MVWDKRERIDRVFGFIGSEEIILDVKKRIGNLQDFNEGQFNIEIEGIRCVVFEFFKFLKELNGLNYFIVVQILDKGIIDSIIKVRYIYSIN